MKKYLSIIVGLMLVLGAAPAFAANDLTLQSGTQISAGGDTFTLTGDYTVDSITVNTDSFTVTMTAGAHLRVSAGSGNRINVSASNNVSAVNTCNSSQSAVELVANNSDTVTVTPSSTVCTDASQFMGGGSYSYTAPLTVVTTVAPASTPAVTPVTTPALTPVPVTTLAPIPASASTPAPVVSAPTSAVSTWEFRTALKVGSKGTAVTELQKRLTAEGVYSGPVNGNFGPLTQAAVKKYQAKYGLEQVGSIGPATRAQLNSAVSVSTPAAQAPAAASQSVEALQAQLQALQAQLLQLLNQQLQNLKK